MHSKYWLVGFVSCSLLACGGRSTPESETPSSVPTETSTPPAYTESVPAAPTGQGPDQPVATTPTPGPAETSQPPIAVEPAPVPLTDGQIAAITDAANTSEVEQAQLAQNKARNARVKKFAAMMITHHSQAKKQQSDLLKRLGITPTENAKSTALMEESQKTLQSLKALNRTEFDRAYIDMQVDAHQKVLDAFDNELIPSAKNSEFKAALVEFRPRIEAHLREGQDIQQTLASAPLNPIGKAESKAFTPPSPLVRATPALE
jgi:putative membrane protein